MIEEEWRREFKKLGPQTVKENVRENAYPPEKAEAALRWLGRADTARKIWKLAKDIREISRVTARRARITLALAVIAVVLLLVAIFMLWRMDAFLHFRF